MKINCHLCWWNDLKVKLLVSRTLYTSLPHPLHPSYIPVPSPEVEFSLGSSHATTTQPCRAVSVSKVYYHEILLGENHSALYWKPLPSWSDGLAYPSIAALSTMENMVFNTYISRVDDTDQFGEATNSSYPSQRTTTSVPLRHTHLSACQWLLFGTVGNG